MWGNVVTDIGLLIGLVHPIRLKLILFGIVRKHIAAARAGTHPHAHQCTPNVPQNGPGGSKAPAKSVGAPRGPKTLQNPLTLAVVVALVEVRSRVSSQQPPSKEHPQPVSAMGRAPCASSLQY